MKTINNSFILMLTALFLLASSCSPKRDQSPREINFERDECQHCLMGLAEKNYSAQSVNIHGEVIWFDDLGCLISYMDSSDWEKFGGDEAVSYIADSQTGEWLNVNDAWFTFGDHTPMGYGYSAHKIKTDSSYNFETTRQRIADGITLREEFLKAKKMLHHD